ncbi:hypothetical protein JCM18909_2595 [Cutibacterium acnes JCM 18909]|nr:hypothetical protein JCM18909_2595 [Cutibacterium acnes JCM 18909]
MSAGTMLALVAPTAPAHAETRYRQINQAAITAVAADSATATDPISNTLDGNPDTICTPSGRTEKTRYLTGLYSNWVTRP